MSDLYLIGETRLPLRVEYQPVIKLGAQPHVSAFECLLRIAPNFTNHTTVTLIEEAEATGTMPELDAFIAKLACRDAIANPDMHLWLNLSQSTISCRQRSRSIAELITSQALADRVTLEMTETVAGNEPVITSNLAWLKKQKLTVVIDDIDDRHAKRHLLGTDLIAGCKFSRLSTIKIIDSPRRFALTAKLVEWCKTNGKTVVLEGIETEREFRLAIDLGVDYCQGFLFWPSLPLASLPALGTPVPLPALTSTVRRPL